MRDNTKKERSVLYAKNCFLLCDCLRDHSPGTRIQRRCQRWRQYRQSGAGIRQPPRGHRKSAAFPFSSETWVLCRRGSRLRHVLSWQPLLPESRECLVCIPVLQWTLGDYQLQRHSLSNQEIPHQPDSLLQGCPLPEIPL